MWITPYARKGTIKGVKSLTFFLPLTLLALGFSLLPYHYITAQTTSIESHQEQQTLQQLSSVLQALKTLLSSLFPQTQAQTADITSGLVAHYKFDEGTGTTANDSSGNNNIGTLINGPTWTTGKIGGALNFDGVNDYVDLSNDQTYGLSSATSEKTISAWVKTTAGDASIVGMRGSVDVPVFDVQVGFDGVDNSNTGRISFLVRDDASAGLRHIHGTIAVNDGAWHHVVVTRNSSKLMTIYVDGKSESSGADTMGSSVTIADARIGDEPMNTSIPNMNGSIDEVRVYNRALTASEITELYNYTGAPSPADTAAPSVPIGLTATAVSSSQINLSWNASTDNVGVTGYRIYRGGIQIATVTSGTTYSNTGLSAGTTYSYTVAAYDAAGNVSAQSSSVSATTPVLDTTPPTVSITAPSAGSTVSGTVTVSASASDNVGVAGVQFKLDGANLGAEDAASPYATSWTTIASANGSHTLTAVVRDAAGNQTISAGIAVTVSNIAPPPPPSGNLHYIRAGATGNGSGSDWTNAAGCLKHLTIARGDLIYLADGDYRACETTVFQFSVATSGTTPVEFRKATIADHGSSTGWSDSMGDGQAILHPIRINCVDYVILNGVSRTSPTAGHGIKIHNTDGAGLAKWFLTALQIGNTNNNCGSSHVTVKYVEIEGSSYNTVNGCAAADSGIIWSWTSGSGVFSTDHLLQYSYVHDTGGNQLALAGNQDTITIEQSYFARNHSGPSCHSEAMSIVGVSNLTFRYNVLEDIEGTAYVADVSDAVTFSNLAFYGNVFWRPSSPARGGAGGGIIQLTSRSPYTGFVNIYNNTFVNANYGNCRLYVGPANAAAITVQNNLWVGCVTDNTGGKPTGVTTWTWDHNAYFDSGSTDMTSTAQLATGNPLENWPNNIFTLLAKTSAGVTLAAPFNTDPLGLSRGADGTWDRGAYEFVSFITDTTPPSIPTALSATVISSSQINLSWTASTDPSSPSGQVSGVAGYRIYRNSSLLTTNNSQLTTYSDTGLSPSTTYTYTVSAYDAAGNTSSQSSLASATTQAPSPNPPPSTKFIINDRVQTTATLNVRATPSTAGVLLGTQPMGALGTVVGGPTNANGFNWWNINYDNAPDGWSVEDFLNKVMPTPTPSPAPPSGGGGPSTSSGSPSGGGGTGITPLALQTREQLIATIKAQLIILIQKLIILLTQELQKIPR